MERLIRSGLSSAIPAIIAIIALVSGVIALLLTPREEEPQIVVPMVDLLIEAPGLSAKQVERQITTPVEKLVAQISGVEHIYSTTRTGAATVTIRFHVGEDREDALLNTYNKLYSNQERIPTGVSNWSVKPVEVDDVPIVILTLWSDTPQLYGDYELRRMANEISTELKAIPRTNRVNIIGGRPRMIQILFDPEALFARQTTPIDLITALQLSNKLQQAGTITSNNAVSVIESGDHFNTVAELKQMVVNVVNGETIYLHEVAEIIDGPAPPTHYTWLDFTPSNPEGQATAQKQPMVAISIAKQTGTNAVWVADEVTGRIADLAQTILPPEVHVEVIRNYGNTANEKVNDLVGSLAIAIATVIVFIGIFLGVRHAIVVGLAVPICYGITLGLDLMFGYTINRVTLFALILSLGLLVDDPITGIDNISRYIKQKSGVMMDQIVGAMMEIRTALLMSTVTIVMAFVPLAYITGMMGPYMAPMAFNVPVSVITSTIVAFLVTPWLASKLLPRETTIQVNQPGIYSRYVAPLVTDRKLAKRLLFVVFLLFAVSVSLPAFRLVPLKLLPFDNKDELQIVIDMPEGSSLEQTAAMATRVGARLRQMPEIKTLAYFVGTPSPMDFNGLIRHYYQRQAPHLADIRLTLIEKSRRADQSHQLVLRMRESLKDLAVDDIKIRVVEVPPGPPVLSTLVAEIYADDTIDYDTQRNAAGVVAQRLEAEPHVVDVDTLNEVPANRWRFVTDKEKAALSGIATTDISTTIATANQGITAGFLNLPRESNPLPINLRLTEADRNRTADLLNLYVKGRPGFAKTSVNLGLDDAPQPLVALSELGRFEPGKSDLPIYHKDLQPVTYVTAEISGRTPAEVIADIHADQGKDDVSPSDWQSRTYVSPGGTKGWELPEGTRLTWGGEGEWRITLRVFRDMGLAFAFALTVIYVVLRFQVGSATIALLIMSSIPLTFVGIMPGFYLLNLFTADPIAGAPDPMLFTATAMIGMIALAGIVVRNSLILVEFITQARERGESVVDAVTQAGDIRLRPILLTAGTTLLGNIIIILDPIFNGLALAIIFGIVSSTLFTLLVVPAAYFLIFDNTGDPL